MESAIPKISISEERYREMGERGREGERERGREGERERERGKEGGRRRGIWSIQNRLSRKAQSPRRDIERGGERERVRERKGKREEEEEVFGVSRIGYLEKLNLWRERGTSQQIKYTYLTLYLALALCCLQMSEKLPLADILFA